jgi:hypothetical protein
MMLNFEQIQYCKKQHICHWCAEDINIGESYVRYRAFDGGKATTIKLHPECESAVENVELEDE